MSLAKRVSKKGLSDVVTTVLIILMTVAAIGLIWAFVIPMVRDNLANATVDKQIDLTIKTAGGESCVDYNKGILVVNVFKGEEDYEVSKLKFIVISEGSSISFVENKGLKKQTGKDFYLNISGLSSVEKVGVAPYVVDGKKEKLYAAIYANIEDKKCASTAINVSKIENQILNEINGSEEGEPEPSEPQDNRVHSSLISGYDAITNCQELQNMNQSLNGNYMLMKDIDCGEFGNFEPIGEYDTSGYEGSNNLVFTGKLNGNNFTISTLSISLDGGYAGLFLGTSGAEISFVGLENLYISYEGTGYVGGLVGESINTQIINSFVRGTISLGSSFISGGLVGVSTNTKIEGSFFEGDLLGPSDRKGGLVGWTSEGSIINNSYSSGNMGNLGSDVGGIIGQSYQCSIINSYSAMNITKVGGNVGGLTGKIYNPVTITNSYYDSEVSGQNDNDGRGEPKTTVQMKTATPFNGWDTSIWNFEEGQYPKLWWQN